MLTDAWVRAALLAVPRLGFMPRRAWITPNQSGATGYLADAEADAAGWCAAAYADASVWLQADDGHGDPATGAGFPTSSISAPGVVVEFLQLLTVRHGNRVLEIGTGSGWTAALLEHLAGPSGAVYSVEVDEAVGATAMATLKAHGSNVTLLVADGALGVSEAAPFDRVHVTCGLTGVPADLIRQARPGGLIVAPWQAGGPNGHRLRLTVTGEQTATGTLHGRANYMLMRSQRVSQRWRAHHADEAETSTTGVDPREVAESGLGAALMIAAQVPGVAWHAVTDDAGGVSLLIHDRRDADGSWAACDHGPGSPRFLVTQYGERRLWDEVVAAFLRWCSVGRPPQERFGVTVDGTELTVWLGEPSRVIGLDRH